jgi:parallel beta-helix repeat protein
VQTDGFNAWLLARLSVVWEGRRVTFALVHGAWHDRSTWLRRVLGVCVAATALSLALGWSATGAQAAHVSCGDTVTADTTLDSDLLDCPNNGIVIGADGITLDLNGHRVGGNGKLVKNCPKFCDVGLLNDGHDDVTVRDGSVREFGFGVSVGRARHARVVRISSSRNLLFGIFVAESARSLVRDSTGSHNLDPEGDGMGLFGSHHVRILHNSFRHNAQPGIHVEDSTHNLIKRNAIARNSDMGILMQGDRNQVRRNRCAGNGVACIIVGPGSRNVIARNHLVGGGDGIGIEEGRGNLVARNVVDGARGDGIYLGLLNPPIGGVATVVRRNVVIGSGKDAFAVRENDHRSVLAFNVAKEAGDDGFDIESRSVTLRENRAARNGDLGIEGVRGINDGGGNVARRNGDPRQCTHISCR